MHRAATCAYAFVAMNWDHVAALWYLARGGDRSADADRGTAPPAQRRGLLRRKAPVRSRRAP